MERTRKKREEATRAKKLLAKQQREAKKLAKTQSQMRHMCNGYTGTEAVQDRSKYLNSTTPLTIPQDFQKSPRVISDNDRTDENIQHTRPEKKKKPKKSKKKKKRKYYSDSDDDYRIDPSLPISPLIVSATSLQNGICESENHIAPGRASRNCSKRYKTNPTKSSDLSADASPGSRSRRRQSQSKEGNLPSAASTPKNKRPSRNMVDRKQSQRTIDPNREKELRAIGQYCPVCSQVYEDDDEASFVCCDSCEMWVHTACDADLTLERISTLTNSSEAYTCPLCKKK